MWPRRKNIGLESFRVRNCDPGADDRLLIDRASQCWNDDHICGCLGQPSGQCAPSRPLKDPDDGHFRPPFAGGSVGERGNHKELGNHNKVKTPPHVEQVTVRGPSPHLWISRPSSSVHADSGSVDIERANHLFGLVSASGRSVSFFSLFMPFLSRSLLSETSSASEIGSRSFNFRTRSVVFSTSLPNVQRTHSWIRMSYEKRNADECPPTGGKSNRHR